MNINFQWLLIKFSGIFLIIGIIIDIEIIIFICNLIFSHMLIGVNSFIMDYLHNKKVSFSFLCLIKISFLEYVSYLFSLLM